jgi:hypothetical protein
MLCRHWRANLNRNTGANSSFPRRQSRRPPLHRHASILLLGACLAAISLTGCGGAGMPSSSSGAHPSGGTPSTGLAPVSLSASDDSWSAPVSTQTSGLGNISCPTPTFCAAVTNGGGTAGGALTYRSGVWSSPDIIDNTSHEALNLVSCVSATFCMAVDVTGPAFTFNGATWSSVPAIALPGGPISLGHVQAVSCPSTNGCLALDNVGNYYRWSAGSWQAGVVSPSFDPEDMSCAASTHCIAVGGKGADNTSLVAFSYDDGTWTGPDVIDANGTIPNPVSVSPLSLSCPSTTFCALVDASGNAYTLTGSSWSGPTPLETASGAGGLIAVSCSSSAFCLALASESSSFAFSGSSWSATSSGIQLPDEWRALSCASSTFCAAGDSQGNGLIYSPYLSSMTHDEPLSVAPSASASSNGELSMRTPVRMVCWADQQRVGATGRWFEVR